MRHEQQRKAEGRQELQRVEIEDRLHYQAQVDEGISQGVEGGASAQARIVLHRQERDAIARGEEA